LIEGDGAAELKLLGEMAQFARISFGQRNVQVQARGDTSGATVQHHARRYAAARDLAVDDVADGGFEHFELARQRGVNLRLFAVDRTEFDRDFEPFPHTLTAPVARHGFHSYQICEIHRLQANKFSKCLVWPVFQFTLASE